VASGATAYISPRATGFHSLPWNGLGVSFYKSHFSV
jgi:hypothetical protein